MPGLHAYLASAAFAGSGFRPNTFSKPKTTRRATNRTPHRTNHVTKQSSLAPSMHENVKVRVPFHFGSVHQVVASMQHISASR